MAAWPAGPTGLRRIGIDEIRYRRGQRFLLVVTDHDSGRLVWAGQDRNAATLNRFFDLLGADRARRLSHVSADGAEWIHQVVAARAPQAVIRMDSSTLLCTVSTLMTGRSMTQTFIVTGGNAGLGFECARFIGGGTDYQVVIAGRDAEKCARAAKRLRALGCAVEALTLDLAALASVRSFVEAYRQAALPPLAGIVCNAGVHNVAAPTKTAEGYETTFGVNHLGHYLLARLLLPDLRAQGHIIFVSSATHDPNEKTGFPEPRYTSAREIAADFEAGKVAARRRYTTSKLCNIYCANELSRHLAASADARLRSIRVSSFDPGQMPGTGLARSYPALFQFGWNYVLPVTTLFKRNHHRPATSGKRLAELVMSIDAPAGGKYYSDGREARSSLLSYNRENAAELWDTSADMVAVPQCL